MDDDEDIEEKCKIIRQNNIKLLEDFCEWLEVKRLSKKTIRVHVNNIELFVNHFLLYGNSYEAKDGVLEVNEFFIDWFIRKTNWANVNQIKANVTSLKKFFTFMFEKGEIKQEELDNLRDIIKEEMPNWITNMKEFEDSMSSDKVVWGRLINLQGRFKTRSFTHICLLRHIYFC